MNIKDLIDDYLANRLGEAEANSFEKMLATNPELKQEYTFHKEVVDSIKMERRAELKSMLNSIPVNSGNSFGPSAKIATTIIGAAVIFGGIYLTTSDKPENNNLVTPKIEIPLEKEPAQTEKITDDLKEETKKNPVEPVKDNSSPESIIEKKENTPAEIRIPDLIEDLDTEGAVTNIDEPEAIDPANSGPELLFNSSIEVITDDSKKKYKFHYQLKDDKLYLYGKFDKGLYEILEFNNDDGRTIILFYKENYYLLNNVQPEITPLTPIEDDILVRKLNNLRK